MLKSLPILTEHGYCSPSYFNQYTQYLPLFGLLSAFLAKIRNLHNFLVIIFCRGALVIISSLSILPAAVFSIRKLLENLNMASWHS